MFHIGYFKNTVQILQCICKSCSRVLLPDTERQVWLKWVPFLFLTCLETK